MYETRRQLLKKAVETGGLMALISMPSWKFDMEYSNFNEFNEIKDKLASIHLYGTDPVANFPDKFNELIDQVTKLVMVVQALAEKK